MLIRDELINTKIQFQPEILVNNIKQLQTKLKYDIIFLSCKSLQDISTLAAELVPYLSKNTILLIESTGFVNLEPFLKNCLSKTYELSIFSIISNVDIRKRSTNEYVNIKLARELIIGESSTSTAKYSKTTQQNLGALSKLFQYKNADSLVVTLKSSFLEFLVEEWKYAISRICFNPLLILFEVSQPSELQQQILAKPLLSGLVTEMITVAKTMGCKLPAGFDNESGLLKTWTNEYSSREVFDESSLFLEAPSLFYRFYHNFSLDIDLLLLQPILLADDHGIKTPYLEFLYATICRYGKLNDPESESIFFKRATTDSDIKALKLQLESNEQLIIAEKQKNEKLASQYKELLKSNERLASKEVELNNVLTSFQNMKLQQENLHATLQTKTKQLHQAEARIQQLQRTAAAAPSQPAPPVPQPLQAPHTTQEPSNGSVGPVLQKQALSQQPPINKQTEQLKQPEYSITGTPDLSDLADAALYGSQLDTPQLNGEAEQNTATFDDLGVDGDVEGNDSEQTQFSTSTTKGHQPPLRLRIPTQGPLNPPLPVDEVSAREQELQKREQMLLNREMELNKKFSQFNGPNRGPPQNVPFHQHQPQNPPTVQSRFNNFSITNGQPPQMFNHQQQLQQQQPQQLQLQPPIQPRRSTMPVLDSNQMFNGGGSMANGNAPLIHNGFQQPVKKTSRKNRKSSFPMGTSNLSDNYNNLIPSGGAGAGAANNSLRPKRSTQLLQQTPLSSNSQGNSPSIPQGPLGPQANQPVQQQANGFPQQKLSVPPQPHFHSNSNDNSKNSSFSSIPENVASTGSSSSVLNPPAQCQPSSNNHSASSANLNGLNGGFDQPFSSDSDAKPLGGVITDIDPNAKDKKKKKKKFGFGKKK